MIQPIYRATYHVPQARLRNPTARFTNINLCVQYTRRGIDMGRMRRAAQYFLWRGSRVPTNIGKGRAAPRLHEPRRTTPIPRRAYCTAPLDPYFKNFNWEVSSQLRRWMTNGNIWQSQMYWMPEVIDILKCGRRCVRGKKLVRGSLTAPWASN